MANSPISLTIVPGHSETSSGMRGHTRMPCQRSVESATTSDQSLAYIDVPDLPKWDPEPNISILPSGKVTEPNISWAISASSRMDSFSTLTMFIHSPLLQLREGTKFWSEKTSTTGDIPIIGCSLSQAIQFSFAGSKEELSDWSGRTQRLVGRTQRLVRKNSATGWKNSANNGIVGRESGIGMDVDKENRCHIGNAENCFISFVK